MPCYPEYVRASERTAEDELNEQRDQQLEQLEQQLGAGTAAIEIDPLTGEARLVGASVQPTGMSDLCVLAALQDRNSLEWQLAAGHAGVLERNFAQQHVHAHQHGHKH